VLELDVVTGRGEFATCSPDRNAELFEMTLAGLGQCALIVRARLRLIPAPSHVALRTLTYDNLDAFLADQARLAATDGIDLLNGRVLPPTDRPARFALIAGSFVVDPSAAQPTPSSMAGLRYTAEEPLIVLAYRDYLYRRDASITASKAKRTPNPSLVASVPENAVRPFLFYLAATPQASVGLWFFEISPKHNALHRRPLQRMPNGALSYELRMQRHPSAENAPDHVNMLAANAALVPRLQAAGATIYPPFACGLTREQWRAHYGAEIWARFAAAKQHFDPNNVLTPGPGIF
jgi:FAD/FMN-containing dehydrogenase